MLLLLIVSKVEGGGNLPLFATFASNVRGASGKIVKVAPPSLGPTKVAIPQLLCESNENGGLTLDKEEGCGSYNGLFHGRFDG